MQVFTKVKELVRNAGMTRGAGRPRAELVDGLRTLVAESTELHERAVSYVHAGTGAEVLGELDQRDTTTLDQLLGLPGTTGTWFYPDERVLASLRAAAPGWSIEKSSHARGQLYAVPEVEVDQLVRTGRLLATVSNDVTRASEGLPVWYAALLNDVTSTDDEGRSLRRGRHRTPGRRARWSPQLLADLLREGGVAADDVPAVVVRTYLDRPAVPSYLSDPYGALLAHPDVVTYLVEHRAVVAHVVPTLRASGKTVFLDLVADHVAEREPFLPVVAALATDPAKSVRVAAVALLATAPAARQVELLAPALTATPASRLAAVVTHLIGVEGGPAALEDALGAAPSGARGALFADALARSAALGEGAAEAAAPIELPPVQPLVDVPLGTEFVTAVRERVDRRLAVARTELTGLGPARKGDETRWRRDTLTRTVKELSAVTDGDLAAAAAYLSGRTSEAPRGALKQLRAHSVRVELPDLSLVHQIRLVDRRSGRGHFPWYEIARRADLEVDLRAVAHVLRGAGVEDVESEVARLVFDTYGAWEVLVPELVWPYFAEHPTGLEQRLGLRPDPSPDSYGRVERTRTALTVLAAFPSIPPAYLPKLTELALGEGKTHRLAAQQVLEKHAGARQVAETGLQSGASTVRATAAAWLARLGDRAAVPALRAALGTERREVARAALLSTLESLGEDITGDLAPDLLLAEARKGLRAKAPASLAWFPWDHLPSLRWADGTAVPAEVTRWWVVLATKLKDPSGLGLVARYVSLLDDASRGAFGRFVLEAWIAQDTRGPSAEESRAYADAGAQQRYDMYQRWARQSPEYYAAEAEKTVDQHHRDLVREHQATYLGSAITSKGLLALTCLMPGTDLASTARAYLAAHPGRRAQIEALVRSLAANPDPGAIQLLLSVARRHRQASVQATAQELAQDLAERRGWTADELADRTVQTAGFDDDGLLRLSVGKREYTGRITPTFTLELTNDAGKVVKTLPAGRADDDPELVKAAKAQFSASRKELKQVVTLQTQRLYEAMCAGRTWPAEQWQELVLGHPVMSRLAATLVWLENPGEGQRAFRPGDGGALIDVEDDDVHLAEDSVVGLAHATLLDAEQARAWRAHLADYAVRPLVDQLGAGTPAHAPGATEISDRRGWLSDSFSIRGRATKRGYTRSQAEDAGWFSEYRKPFAGVGITAVVGFTGAFLPEENIPAAVTELTFERVGARGRRSQVPLAELPPVLLAECYQDYVTVADAGRHDPEWEKKSAW